MKEQALLQSPEPGNDAPDRAVTRHGRLPNVASAQKQGQQTTALGLLNVLSAHRVRSHAPARHDCQVTLPALPPKHSRQRLRELKQSAVERDFARLRTPDYADCVNVNPPELRQPKAMRLVRPSSLASLGQRGRAGAPGPPGVGSSQSLPNLLRLRGDLASALEDMARELRTSEEGGGEAAKQIEAVGKAPAATVRLKKTALTPIY